MAKRTIVGRIFGCGDVVQLSIEGGRITAIDSLPTETGDGYPSLAPGFFDLQVNGFSGVDFNQPNSLTFNEYQTATEALWSEGCTGFMPTLITNSADFLATRFRELCNIRSQSPRFMASTTGFHLEGPFISPIDGPRGAHDRQFVRAPDLPMFQQLQEAAEHRIRIVTLSPEWDNADAFATAVQSTGVRVSIGHSAASPASIASSAKSGATMVTHFGNGVAQQVARHPNILWEQLACDDLTCSLIADGFHLPSSVLKTVFRAKGERAILVSDSTSLARMPPGDYVTHVGGKVTLTPEGRLHLTKNPALQAGSAQSLRHCVEFLCRQDILSMQEAWRRASTLPAQFMRQPDESRIRVGALANLVEYTFDERRLQIRKTWLHGDQVYSSGNGF
jgi:N-acetylglucosamine-6-phosphate deacetylase